MYPMCSRNLNMMVREMESMEKRKPNWMFTDEEYNIWNEEKTLGGFISRLETTEENIS